jgi:hypothetical protein
MTLDQPDVGGGAIDATPKVARNELLEAVPAGTALDLRR